MSQYFCMSPLNHFLLVSCPSWHQILNVVHVYCHQPYQATKKYWTSLVYTSWAIKTCHFILDHSCHVYWWIFTLPVSVIVRRMIYTGVTKLTAFYLNCYSALPDKDQKHTKRYCILKSIVTIFYYSTLNSKNESVR